jgi:hypothetical protein
MWRDVCKLHDMAMQQNVDRWSLIGAERVEAFIFHSSIEPCCFACKNSLVWS